MESKKFYDVVLEDVMAFDKVLFDLEQMSANAPNARIRTVADTAILHIKLAQEISLALQKANGG